MLIWPTASQTYTLHCIALMFAFEFKTPNKLLWRTDGSHVIVTFRHSG